MSEWCDNYSQNLQNSVVYRYPKHLISSAFEFCAHDMLKGKVCVYKCNNIGAVKIRDVAESANTF